MSGNPFRRPTSTAAEGNLQRDTTPPPSKGRTRKKKVKILSPPRSPEEPPRRPSAGRISPPPPPQSPDDEEDTDSTATADSELEEAVRNTRRNSGSLPPPPGLGTSSVKAPYNPFARTLATQEAAFGVEQSSERQRETGRHDEEGEPRRTNGTAGLDVDEFKNILLTGSAPPSQAVSTWSQRLHDNGSSTDASSVSRQSLADPMREMHPETPATPVDHMGLLESPSEDSDDDEGSSLVSGSNRLDELASPTPPKHHDGSKGPRTVSFDDFDDSSFSKPARTATSTTAAHMSPSDQERPVMMDRSSSDLNKSLPAPSMNSTIAQDSRANNLENNFAASQQFYQSSVPPDVPNEQKKAPPPPPAARRTVPERRRSDSSSNRNSISTRGEEAPPPPKPAEATNKSAVPPPPPSRKARPVSQIAASNSGPAPEVASPAPATLEAKSMRPPPPPRSASRPESIVKRGPSTISRPALSRNEPSSSSQNAPPAPPPRRSAVNSARNSIDGRPPSLNGRRRSSEYSSNTERSTSLSRLQNVAESVETLHNVPVPSQSSDGRDVLADMSAFQAEIDALRAQAGNAG